MPGPAWEITNGIVCRAIHLAEDGPHTAWLGPKAGPTLQLESSEEFLLRLEGGQELGGADFTWSAEIEESPVGEGGLAVALRGTGKDVPLRIRLIYTVPPGKTYMHKQIALQATGNEPVLVRDVQVERAKVKLSTTDLGGLGQPVLVEIGGWGKGEQGMATAGGFWGLEYPAADNRQQDGLVTLEHHPGVWVGSDGWWYSKPAVFGFAEKGDAAGAFRSYLASTRRPPRSYVVYNSWYDLRRGEMTVETLIDRARQIHEELTVKRGAPFDAVVLDDGWQDRQSIWEIEEADFPDGFAPLKQALDEMGVRIGLWHPLTAVNGNLDAQWGAANGYEVSPEDRFFCLSGPKHNRALREELRRHTTEYDIDYFKHDFNAFACAGEGHGHLPEAAYGREANVDAEIEMFRLLTRLNPRVYINPSGGMWLSPWWLKYVDTVWMGHCADFGTNKQVVAYEPRDWAMTYRDAAIYQNLHGDRSQFPASGIMTIGIIDGQRNRLGGENEPLDRWANNVVINVGRGSMLKELYITPDLLSGEQWDILASALKWQQQYVEQMAGGRMLPVDPRWADVYGYVHVNADGGFVCLRNSGIVSRYASVSLPELPGAIDDYQVRRVYPWQEGLPLERSDGVLALGTEVEPYGTTVVEIVPSGSVDEPLLRGVRASIVEREPGKVTYEVWGRPGSEATVTVDSPTPIRAVRAASQPLAEPPARTAELMVRFPGEPYHLWQVRAEGADEQAGSGFAVVADEGTKWRCLVVAHQLPAGHSPVLSVDGEACPGNTIEGEGWRAFMFEVPEGRHEVSWAIPPADTEPEPFAAPSYWVEPFFVREAKLSSVRVEIAYEPTGRPLRERLQTPHAGVGRTTWVGPKATFEPEAGPQNTPLSAEDLANARAAKLHIKVFGSQGGEDYGRKWITLNGQRIGALPVNSSASRPDVWEEAVIDLAFEQMALLRLENGLVIERATGDCFKLTDLALAVQRADGRWAETNHDGTVWCSPAGWLHQEGRPFDDRTPVVTLRFRQ